MADSPAGAAASSKPTLSRIEVAGATTRLLEAGPRDATEAVVFVHGNPGSADDWGALIEVAAAAGRRALSFDLPDFGEAIAPAGFAHDVPAYADFLDAALTQLGVERVHLVIHDFGGPIGLYWAVGHPERLASVTEIDTGILPGYKWHFLARIWRTPVLGELFQATATRGAFRFLTNRAEPRGLPNPFIDQMYDHFDRRTKRAVLKLYRATDDPGEVSGALAEALAPHDVPALVIWGAGDAYLPASYAERQREAFPEAEVHVLAESGHWPFADAPAEVAELFGDFLARRGAVSGAPQ